MENKTKVVLNAERFDKNSFLVCIIEMPELPEGIKSADFYTECAVVGVTGTDEDENVVGAVYLSMDEKEAIGDQLSNSCVPIDKWVWCNLYEEDRPEHVNLIASIIKKNGNPAEIERVLEIPQGFLEKMSNQDSVLPEELTLLKMINRFPELINVAANNFKIPDHKEAIEYIKKKGGVSRWKDTNNRMSMLLYDAAEAGLVKSILGPDHWVLL